MKMIAISDKIMFEVYRETDYNRLYRVVYYTELNEHNKEYEINRAMAGEHIIDGYILETEKESAKKRIQELISELNSGNRLSDVEMRIVLQPFLSK